jgi:hypothetical protein
MRAEALRPRETFSKVLQKKKKKKHFKRLIMEQEMVDPLCRFFHSDGQTLRLKLRFLVSRPSLFSALSLSNSFRIS